MNDLKAILTADDNIMISWPRKLEIAIGADMTISGARQLSEIFLQPRIEDVTINQAFNESNPLVMRAIVLSAVASIAHFALTWHLLSDDDVVMLGAALDGNTTLRSLKFYVANWSLPAVTSLAQGIGKSQISTLRLHGSTDTRHDTDDVEALQISLPAQEILFDQGVRLSQTIHHLTVRYYMHAIPNALVRCVPRLQTLNVSPEGEMIDATRLAHSLRGATQLSSLKIDLYLEKSDVYLVCEALPHLPLLESLGLSCDLASYENGDTDFRGMFSDLDSSDVGAFGAECLMVAVVNHPCIVKLSLARSYDIGFKGLDTIGRHLSRTNLEELILDEIFDCFDSHRDGVAALAAHQSLVDGVRNMTSLKVFSANEVLSFLSPKLQEILACLYVNKWRHLKHFVSEQEGLWCHILAKFKNEAGVMHYLLTERPTLALSAS